MQDNKLFKYYTIQELLYELDTIESFESINRKMHLGEITKKQSELFEKLRVTPPTSL